MDAFDLLTDAELIALFKGEHRGPHETPETEIVMVEPCNDEGETLLDDELGGES